MQKQVLTTVNGRTVALVGVHGSVCEWASNYWKRMTGLSFSTTDRALSPSLNVPRATFYLQVLSYDITFIQMAKGAGGRHLPSCLTALPRQLKTSGQMTSVHYVITQIRGSLSITMMAPPPLASLCPLI